MNELKIYIDGSHLDKLQNGRLGCGGLAVVDNKVIGKFSRELNDTYLSKTFGVTTKCSNPCAELIAVYEALKSFQKEIRSAESVVIMADYMGVREWMTGNWRVQDLNVKKIKNKIDPEIQKQNLTHKIEFQWVKGHQTRVTKGTDAYWNNKVDKLAKGEEIDEQ